MKRFLPFLLLGLLTSSLHAATVTVPAGGDFQAALNRAAPGDTIILTAGATYNAPPEGFVLPNKGNNSALITIQSSALSSLPPAGHRVRPSDTPRMARLLLNANGAAVMSAEQGANHYLLIGIEFALSAGRWSYRMVEFGSGNETNVNQLPYNMTLDRCYIHGDPTARPGTKRGVQMNGINITVENSYISEIHVAGQDAQAINGWNGPGPFIIRNNYLEASTENILFGGSDPKIPGLVPSNIEIRNNYLYKPMSWRNGPWDIKNTLELKNARQVLIDGNIFENCWEAGQVGIMILFTPRNQEGTAPISAVQDITFTNNILRNTGSAISIAGEDNLNSSQQTQRITIRNNVFENIDSNVYGGMGRIFQFTTPNRPALDVTIDHNTLLHGPNSGGASAYLGDCCSVLNRFTFTNNIVTYGEWGFKGNAVGEGLSALSRYVPSHTFTRNAFVGGGRASDYPNTTYFPSNIANVSFVNVSAGNYRLSNSSPYRNAGTDGKDLGADIEVVEDVTCGVVQGVPNTTCSGVTPPPPSRCDLNSNGVAEVGDLQQLINRILQGSSSSTFDLNRDSNINALDLQIQVNVVLGRMTCPS